MDDITYLFIDGGYLQTVFRDTIQSIFGDSYGIDYAAIKKAIGARRVFYYDCIDNIQKANESTTDFKARVQKQEVYLDSIDALEGFHVRRGHLASSRGRKQQKEVDVLLAVDMMVHSFNRTMSKAVLISGDRDFKPVVKAVTGVGTYAEVMYRRKTGSAELGRVADVVSPLCMVHLVKWARIGPGEKRDDHFPPSRHKPVKPGALSIDPKAADVRHGCITSGDSVCPLVMFHSGKGRYFCRVLIDNIHQYQHHFLDKEKLDAFVTEQYGPITWQQT